jgi:hypothetical protein
LSVAWFKQASINNTVVSIKILKEKTLHVTATLKVASNFRTSNGWINKFKQAAKFIKQDSIRINHATMEVRTEKMAKMIKGYSSRGIWNMKLDHFTHFRDTSCGGKKS